MKAKFLGLNEVKMILEEMLRLFLSSRKRGTGGAKRKCSPKTLEVYERNLKMFFDWLLEHYTITRYESIRRLQVVNFLDWIEERERSGQWQKATALQLLRVLRTFFRWVDSDEDCKDAELHGMQKYLPVIEKTPRRTFIPQPVELRKFKNAFNTNNRWGFRDYVIVSLVMTNGIRLGEVCNLTLENTRLEDKTLIVEGKTGKRLVPVTQDMVRLLKAWLKRRLTCEYAKDSPYVFVTKRAPKLTVNAFGLRLRKLRKKHGLPQISAHTLRHAFCTYYLRNGGNIEKLRNITGHTTYQMLQDYLHLAEVGSDDAKAELEKVNPLKEV